jgi:hypothetical protein
MCKALEDLRAAHRRLASDALQAGYNIPASLVDYELREAEADHKATCPKCRMETGAAVVAIEQGRRTR